MSDAAKKLTLSTGIEVGIRKVSPYTLDAVRRSIPAPTPPMIRNEYGPGDVREEPNEADPGYLRAVKNHQQAIGTRAQDLMLSLGVALELDDAGRQQLSALREGLTALGVEIEKDDRIAYIKHIAIGSDADLKALADAITSKSQPTEEAVQDHLNNFPGDVPGA